MANNKIILNKGLTVGNTVHKDAVLREPTAGDLMQAMEESERVVMVAGEPQLLLSNTALSLHTLRRQIVSIGDINGPIDMAMLSLLSATDLSLLQSCADELDTVIGKELAARGRSNAAE